MSWHMERALTLIESVQDPAERAKAYADVVDHFKHDVSLLATRPDLRQSLTAILDKGLNDPAIGHVALSALQQGHCLLSDLYLRADFVPAVDPVTMTVKDPWDGRAVQVKPQAAPGIVVHLTEREGLYAIRFGDAWLAVRPPA